LARIALDGAGMRRSDKRHAISVGSVICSAAMLASCSSSSSDNATSSCHRRGEASARLHGAVPEVEVAPDGRWSTGPSGSALDDTMDFAMGVHRVHPRAWLSFVALSMVVAASWSCSRDAAPSREPSPMFESEEPPMEVGAMGRAVRLSDQPHVVGAEAVREAEVCGSLRDAAVSVHEVPRGVVIELRPTEHASVQSLQAGAAKLERALQPSARLVTAIGPGRQCDLREVAEHRARVRVERSHAAIVVYLTAVDPRDIDRLRSAAREFAEELQYAPPLEPPL
jgi:hypothetical protein